jgi:hypothetical protein
VRGGLTGLWGGEIWGTDRGVWTLARRGAELGSCCDCRAAQVGDGEVRGVLAGLLEGGLGVETGGGLETRRRRCRRSQ